MKYIISATAILLANVGVFALPQGGSVESGKGNLDNPAHIIQESQHLQTRWNSFDIGATEQVRIEQPNAQASINIKVRNGATTINGTLTANGRVSLENPAGIQFGDNAVVNVGGLLASSAKGAVTSLGQVSAAEVVRFQGLSSKNIVNIGGAVSAQEIIVESNGDIVIGNSATFTASKQVLIGGGYRGKDLSVLNARTTDVKAAAHITAPRVIVWSDKVTRFLGRIDAGRGFVEVSGKQHLIFPDISRAIAGTLLLDPRDITIIGTPPGNQITNDGTVGLNEAPLGNIYISAIAIRNYNGNVSLAATGTITVNADIFKNNNGSLILEANKFVINATITILDPFGIAGYYLSFEQTGSLLGGSPFTFGSGGGTIYTPDLRLIRTPVSGLVFHVPTNLAAPGRNITIIATNTSIGFLEEFNLCLANNTGCGDLTINARAVNFFNRTINTIKAKSINIIMSSTLDSTEAPLELIAYDGDVSITAPGGGTIYSYIGVGRDFDFSASGDVILKDVEVAIGSGTMTLNAGVGSLSTGSVVLTGSSFTTLNALFLSQDKLFSVIQPFLSSVAPVTATYTGTGLSPAIAWGTLVYQNAIPSDVNVSDGNLASELAGKFEVSSNGILDLGDFNLTATTATLVVPLNITTIRTTGTISIARGLSRGVMLTLTADTMVLGGTVAVGLENQLFLNSPNPITASSNLRIEAVIFLNAPSLGSAGFDLWTFTFLAFGALELLGNDITINGNGAAAPHPLTITADNDIILEGAVSASTLALEAKAGGVIFSTVAISGASRIDITQADPYVVSAAATFSTKPILNSPIPFNRPSWGVCGTNCASSEDLSISDGDLAAALVGKFILSGSTLDLGSFNLTADTVALDIPSHITTITTTGTISITSGLTASAPLTLTARGALTIGGNWDLGTNALALTTSTGAIAFNSGSDITASSITLTQVDTYGASAPAVFSTPPTLNSSKDFIRPSWGLCGTNCLTSSSNLFVTDGDLAAAIVGRFNISSNGTLDLGKFNLVVNTTALDVPPGIYIIRTTGVISIRSGLTATAALILIANRISITHGLTATAAVSLTASTMVLGGTFTTGSATLKFSSSNPITASSALTVNSHLTFSTFFLGSAGFDLSISSFVAPRALQLLGKNITLGGVGIVNGSTLTVTADNDLAVNGDLTAATISLEARAGSITFSRSKPAITAPTINLTQANPYDASAPATFSTTPILNSSTSFVRPLFWGSCGTNCLDFAPVDLVITDGDLAAAIAGRLQVSGGTLDLGGFNLTAHTVALDIPSHITSITTTGKISLASGLTATASVSLTAGTMELGDTFTTGSNTLTLFSAMITAVSALTINSPLALSAFSLGSARFDLTLAGSTETIASGRLELLGRNITLNGAVTIGGFILTITADNDLVVNNNITAGRIVLEATRGGITFASSRPTIRAFTGQTINLTQADPYGATEPTNFSTPPILNRATLFVRPSWGVCGINCIEPSSNLIINDGDLAAAIVGKFQVSSGTLDLGGTSLIAHTVALDIPSHITSITTTGTISITGGLTAAQGLDLNAGSGLTIGGSWDLGLNALTLTVRTGAIAFNSTPTITASTITLTQVDTFDATEPATFSTTPILNSPNRFNKPTAWGVCGTNCFEPTDLVITDGSLATAIVGKFGVSSSILDLGSFNLTVTTTTLIIPLNIQTILTTGTISIASGLTAPAMLLNLSAGTMELGGTFTTRNILTLTSANPITASSALTIGATLILDAPLLGTAGIDLTLEDITSSSVLELLGNNITLGGANSVGSFALTITADNDIALNGAITLVMLTLEATAGGVTFSNVIIDVDSGFEITQADPYAATVPATFSNPPTLNRAIVFASPSWGVCGTNCFPSNFFITDGDLDAVIAGKFDTSSGTLDLGDLNLTATIVALDIPSHILSITTTGTISITGGLTATASLTFTADTIELGGTLTAGTNTLTLNTANPIPASSALTISSPLILSAPSLGSAGIDLTLADVTSLNTLELLGSNIMLFGAITTNNSALTITADNDLAVNGAITTNNSALTITADNDIAVNGAITTNNSALTITADNDIAVNGDLTAAILALEAKVGSITFASTSTAVTASTINLTQADTYGATEPATFSSTPILNSSNRFNKPTAWGICGTNCLVPTDLIITDGGLAAAIVDRFDVFGGRLDLGDLNLTATTTTLTIPSHIRVITTTGTISIASGLTASAALTLSASTMVLGGTLTRGASRLTLNSANPITASRALRIEAVASVSAPSLGSAGVDLSTAAFTAIRALELLGKNITIAGNGTSTIIAPLTITADNNIIVSSALTTGVLTLEAKAGGITFDTTPVITAPTITLTQVDPYVVLAPATFSTPPILNNSTRFNRPSWGACGINCLDPTDLVIADGGLAAALVDRFDVFSGTLDLGSLNLTATTVALDIPSHITSITTTGKISLASGLTATASVSLTAGTMELGDTFTTGSNTLTLFSAMITAVSALTINSPLALSALSLGSAGIDLTLADITSSSALELLGSNITLNDAVTTNGSATITADNDIAVRGAITATMLTLEARAGGITFASTSTAITAPKIELTQTDPYAVLVPADFSTPPILNSPIIFSLPLWGVCGTNCFGYGNLVIPDGNLESALVGSGFSISGGTLDLGSFSLIADTVALDIPSNIMVITTTGTISIMGGLTAQVGQTLLADTVELGGTFVTGTSGVLTLISSNPIAANDDLTINSPLVVSAPSLGSAGFDLTLAGVTSATEIELLGSNITLNGVVTAFQNTTLTITADNDLVVNNTIMAETLALEARAGGITFASTSTEVTASRINLTQADVYDVNVPATFSTTPIVSSASRFSKPTAWGACGTNCFEPVDLVITDGDLTTPLADRFDVFSGTLDLGSFNLTAHTVALDIPSHITTITTTGTISITDGLTAAQGLDLNAGGGLTIGGSWDLGLNALALTTDTGAIAFNNTPTPTITASTINLTQTTPYAVLAPADFSTPPILNGPNRFNKPTAWGVCGTNCFEPTDLVIADGGLAATIVGKFGVSGSILDLGGFNLTAHTVALDIPSHITTITTTGTISITDGLTAAQGLDLNAGGGLTIGGSWDLGLNALTLTARGAIAFNSTPTITASTINLTQTTPYGATAPATFSTPPILNGPNRFDKPTAWGVCGTNCFEPTDLVIADGGLAAAIAGRFGVSGSILDLGSFNLTANTVALVVPSHITTITTTGMISIVDGLTATAALNLNAGTISIADGLTAMASLTFTADTIELGGILTTDTNALTLTSANPITASSALTISSPLILDAPSLGSASFDLTLVDVTSSNTLELLGNNITLNGVITTNNSALTITADNDIAVNGAITAAILALEAKAGGITFASTSTAVTASTINLTQADTYDVNVPATFSSTPILNSSNRFNKLTAWGVCGTNCLEPTDLVIIDGDLTTPLVGRFDLSGTTLDLGAFNLTATTTTLIVPSHIRVIITTGTIRIASGLTALAKVLHLNAPMLVLGGTFTAPDSIDVIYFTSPNPIAASSDLRIESFAFVGAPSLGSAGFDLSTAAFLAFEAFELLGKNITIAGNGGANTHPLTITADNNIAVNGNITAGMLTLEAKAGGITFNVAAAITAPTITAPTITLTQAAPYVATEPATFSTTPILNRPNRFNRPSWGACGINCLDPTDLVITDGILADVLVDRFDVLSGTLDLGSLNLTANTVALVIPSHILSITTTGTISIVDGLTATAALTLSAPTMVLAGTLTAGSNTLTLTSANAITASSALTISSPLVVAAPLLGSAGIDLTLADTTSSSALELLGSNITLNDAVTTNGSATITADNDIAVRGAITATMLTLEARAGGITFASTSTAITASTINLTQVDAYVATEPATFSATPILNSPLSFASPSWGVCGTNCFGHGNLVIPDGNLESALVGSGFSISGGTLNLGSFDLIADTVALVIPSNIMVITTTGTISIMGGFTAQVGQTLFADTVELGGTFVTGTSGVLTLISSNPIAANDDLTINSPLVVSAPSLGSAGFDLTLVGVTSSKRIELLGSNITLNGVVTTLQNIALTITADNDLVVNNTIMAETLALEARAGGITFASTSTEVTASTINLTQADTYDVNAPAIFSTTPIVSSPMSFINPSWALCGTNCSGPGPADLFIVNGDLTSALVDRFVVSSGTLDLGDFNLTAHTSSLDIPSHITAITTTGTISIADGLTASAALTLTAGTLSIARGLTTTAALTLTADMLALGGTLTAGTNTLTLNAANPITANGDLTIGATLILDAPSLGSAGFDLTLADITSSSALDLLGSNITLNGAITTNGSATITADNDLAVNGAITADTLALEAKVGGITFASTSTAVTASTIELAQAVPYVVLAPADFSTLPILHSSTPFIRPFWGSCGINCSSPKPADLVITDGDLDAALVGKFEILGNVLNLGSFNLTAHTSSLDIPSHITTITTTGTISIADGFTASAALTLSAPTLALGGTLTAGSNTLTLTSANPITARSALTISSPLVVAAPLLGSAGVDLWISTLRTDASIELFGNNVTLGSDGTTTNTFPLTITADKDIMLAGLDVGALVLEAKAGGITFASTSTTITATTIELTQTDPYATTEPAVFSTPPTLNRPTRFALPSWGVCGANCIGTGNLFIIDGDLGTAIVGRFKVLGGTLDLGSLSLIADTTTLDIPSHITTITTTGIIIIVDGLTATASLTLNADAALTLGGSWDLGLNALDLTTDTGAIIFNSGSDITAGSIVLTQANPYTAHAPTAFSTVPTLNSPNPFARPLWGFCGRNCSNPTPANLVITSGSLVAAIDGVFPVSGGTLDLGSFDLTATTTALIIPPGITTITTTGTINIISGLTATAALTLSAGAHLIISGSLNLGLNDLALTVSTGAIAFTNNPTITAGSIVLTQVDIYVDAESATYSTPPTLNSDNLFLRPPWGLCGTNCALLLPTNLVITDGNLANALSGKFKVFRGTLDLGSFDLTADTTPLVISPNILRITTTGTISITGGLTTSAPLSVNAGGALTVGGTWNLSGTALVLKTTGTEAIVFNDHVVIMASPITLMQTAEFSRVVPADFSGVTPLIMRTGASQHNVPWATGGTSIVGNLTMDAGGKDIILVDEIIGYFPIVGDTLDLGSNDLNLSTLGTLILPANVTNITTTGDIKLDVGDIRGGGNNFTISARNLFLRGMFNFGNASVSFVVAGKLDFSGNPALVISIYRELVDPNTSWAVDYDVFKVAADSSGEGLTIMKLIPLKAPSKSSTANVTLRGDRKTKP